MREGEAVFDKLTPAQCRAARGLLRWSQAQLAEKSQISVTAIQAFEAERTKPQRPTLALLARGLEKAGVILIPANGEGPGVRLRKAKGRAL